MLLETTHAPALFSQALPPTTMTAIVVMVALVVLGLLGWLVAVMLGFARARAFRPSTRWFALSALCVLLYHLHLFAFGFLGTMTQDLEKVMSFGAFFNVWIVLGSICAIIGFLRLTNPRP